MTYEARRLKRLKGLRARLDAGNNVSPRDMKQWLTREQHQFWQSEEERIRGDAMESKEPPREFDPYVALLKKADFAFNKSTGLSGKKPRKRTSKAKLGQSSSSKLEYDSQAIYEKALEKLNEILSSEPTYAEWLDRSVDFSFESSPSIDSIGMPRLRTSKSQHVQQQNKTSIRQEMHDAKKNIIDRAIGDIENPSPPSSNSRGLPVARLNELRKLLRR